MDEVHEEEPAKSDGPVTHCCIVQTEVPQEECPRNRSRRVDGCHEECGDVASRSKGIGRHSNEVPDQCNHEPQVGPEHFRHCRDPVGGDLLVDVVVNDRAAPWPVLHTPLGVYRRPWPCGIVGCGYLQLVHGMLPCRELCLAPSQILLLLGQILHGSPIRDGCRRGRRSSTASICSGGRGGGVRRGGRDHLGRCTERVLISSRHACRGWQPVAKIDVTHC
mmetsp:Transcript_22952/g.63707  ORF Transcript_22952/g.63707 Transcript_22952/m.63707 type:complete len:220 (-) Transcript_22952:263-922(-)